MLATFWNALGAAEKEEVPLEMRPYRVNISVAFAPDAFTGRTVREQICKELAKACVRRFGAAWTDAGSAVPAPVTVTENRRLVPPTATGLSRLALEDVAPAATANGPAAKGAAKEETPAEKKKNETADDDAQIPSAEKVFTLTLGCDGPGFRIAGREVDLQVHDVGPIIETRGVTRTGIVGEAVALLARLFRPIAEIEEIEGKEAVLCLQAADLRPDTIEVGESSLLRPVLRFRDPRDGQIRLYQDIRWTFLRVTHRERFRCQAHVLSGIRAALGTKRMRLVDRFALLVRPAYAQTQCTLYPQGEAETRLVGYRVLAIPPLPVNEKEEKETPAPPLELLTDYRGRVVVKRNPDMPLCWLSIRSGKSRLASIPFVPGQTETLDIPLPNDRVRLSVDGQLSLLEGDLVSLIAERALLTSLARKAARTGDNKEADKRLAEITNLPSLRAMSSRLNLIRDNGKLQAAGDRIAVALIDRECDRLLGVLRRYLDQTRMDDLRNEIKELKEVYKSDRKERQAVEKGKK